MDDVTVSREDQQNINKFSRLNLELTNLEALLKEKRVPLFLFALPSSCIYVFLL